VLEAAELAGLLEDRMRGHIEAAWRTQDMEAMDTPRQHFEEKALHQRVVNDPFAPYPKREWAVRHGVRAHTYKSGDDHEFVLRAVCLGVCAAFRHVTVKFAGAMIGQVEPDALFQSRDGLVAPVQVSDANTPEYEAERLIALAQVPEVDRVVFVALREKTGNAVQKLLSPFAGQAVFQKLAFLKAEDVVSGTVDWHKVLAEARRERPDCPKKE